MNNKGFTVIELIIVVSIVAILVSIGMPSYFRNIENTALEADEMSIYQLNDITESYAMTIGASLDYSSSDFVFRNCEVNGSLDADLMMNVLTENGFMIFKPDVETKNGQFSWNKLNQEWELIISN